MNLATMIVIVGALIFIAIFSAAYAISIRVLNVRERVRSASDEGTAIPRGRAAVIARMVGWIRPLGEMIPRSPEEMSRQERRIVQAGIRRRDSAVILLGIQAGVAMLALFLFGVTGQLGRHAFVYGILSILLGALIPDLILSRLIAGRKERIQLGLPDALDLTVVCVEAGLGLDQALMRIGQEIRMPHPDLSEELRLANLEMNMGRTRADALRNLGRRSGVDDLKALCAILIQTDRFGTSIGQALRVYAESLRTKRRQRAEERAAKIAVKMIPPLVVFIFPAMFVVIVGPAVISILRDLLPTMSGR